MKAKVENPPPFLNEYPNKKAAANRRTRSGLFAFQCAGDVDQRPLSETDIVQRPGKDTKQSPILPSRHLDISFEMGYNNKSYTQKRGREGAASKQPGLSAPRSEERR